MIFYPSGQVHQQLVYRFDKLEGKQKLFHENGIIHTETEMQDGLYQGYSIIYHDNGEMWVKRFYIDNYIYNIEFNNDRNGKPRDKGTLKNGNGTMIRYDESDKIIFVYEFKNGYGLNWVGDESVYKIGN